MYSEDLREQIKKDRKTVALSQAAYRLQQTTDFREIISHNLLQVRVNALVSQLASWVKDSPEYAAAVRELDAISYLRHYLVNLESEGAEALASLKEAQLLLDNEE